MHIKPIPIALLVVLAAGLVGAGCGGDEEAITLEDGAEVTVPTSAQDAIDQAGENADEAIEDTDINALTQECLDNVDQTDLPEDQADSLRRLCENRMEGPSEALENLGG